MQPEEPHATPAPAPPTFAPPLPVQALDYSPPRPSRPGILTAVGVISLVIGALSALFGCSSAFTSVMFQYMPQVTPAVPTTAPAAPTTTTAGGVTFTTTTVAGRAAIGSRPRDVSTLVLGLTDAILRLALAVLLIVAGILVLRDHRLGRKLHVIWAWVKIPVALLGAIVYWRTMSGMFTSMPATPGSPVNAQFMDTMMLVGGLFQAALACAYPVGVLIVMKTRTVRDYYATQLGVRDGG